VIYNPIENFPQEIDLHDNPGAITSPPILVEVTGDGKPEYLIGTNDGEIFIISATGDRIAISPIAAPAGISKSLAFCPQSSSGNYRGNLYAASDDGLIYGFTIGSIESEDYNYYYQYAGGSHHRNFQEIPLQKSSGTLEFLSYSYNYPNPAEGFTNIRFEVSEDAQANIRIYDLAGRLVFEHEVSAFGNMANEYEWDVTNYPSGVYHCRLEVKGSQKSEVKFWNIAVIK